MTMLTETRTMLDRALAEYTLREIAGDDGAISYEWLKKLKQGRIPDPGVTRVEALHARLKVLLRRKR